MLLLSTQLHPEYIPCQSNNLRMRENPAKILIAEATTPTGQDLHFRRLPIETVTVETRPHSEGRNSIKVSCWIGFTTQLLRNLLTVLLVNEPTIVEYRVDAGIGDKTRVI